MNPTILRTNATPVYDFLSLLHASLDSGDSLSGKRILDCGAGGPLPPLSIFAECGMTAVGIDISDTQLEKAKTYAAQHGLSIDLRQADMRSLPFEDASFDYVYEHYSMCHLSKADTARAISEMHRVLKPGGIAFLGVVSQDCWPGSEYGEERAPGERWMIEAGEDVCHSLFDDDEALRLLSEWEIAFRKKDCTFFGAPDVSEDAWMALYGEAPMPCTQEEWAAHYARREHFYQYVHHYFYLEKPEV